MDLISATVGWLADPVHWAGPSGIPARVGEHLALSLGALAIAALVALPAGLWAGHARRGDRLAVSAANLGRAIPSLALIGIAVPFTVLIDPQLGFKVLPTLIAMVALGIPPILVNTITGVKEVDADTVEAARGMGLTELDVLRDTELPLALPAIAAGLGSAAVQIIATATLGALFGFGGLGSYLAQGIAQNDDGMIFAGVVLVALLALATAGAFSLVAQWLASPGLAAKAPAERSASTL
jgi:osmoprotectant transport system permease protein